MSSSDSKESATPLESTTNVNLDPAVVEQLVLAAVAAASSLPPQQTDGVESVSTTTTTTTTAATTPISNDVVRSPDLINFTDAQLKEIQAQAIAQSTDYQQLLVNMNNKPTTKTKDPITDKVRQENRERKKRWRQQNQDRNKDNDLRCRVNKRANKLFGKEDSEHKRKWVEEEFEKRKSKRQEKEERKLNSPTQQPAVEGLHSLLADPYISLLANNLSAFTSAAAAADTPVSTTPPKDDKFTTQLLEFLQQQQQNQDFDASLALMNGVPTNNPMVVDEKPAEESNPDTGREEGDATTQAEKEATPSEKKGSEADNKPDYPMDAVLTLMQLNAGWRQ